MAFSYVQHAANSGDFFDNGSVTVNLSAPTSGNLLVVVTKFFHGSRTLTSLALGTNSFSEAIFMRGSGSTGNATIYVNYGLVTDTSDTSLVVTLSGSVAGDTFSSVVIYEFSGSTSPAAVDDTASAETATTVTHAAGNVTTTTNESLLVGACYGTGGTYNVDADWDATNDIVSGNGITAYKIITGATTTEDMDITTDANETVANVIAAFTGQLGGGGSSVVPVFLHHLRQHNIS